jgi:hypothetical protein
MPESGRERLRRALDFRWHSKRNFDQIAATGAAELTNVLEIN